MHLLHIDCTVIDRGFIANRFVDCYFKILIFMFGVVLVFIFIFVFGFVLVFIFISRNTFLNPGII